MSGYAPNAANLGSAGGRATPTAVDDGSLGQSADTDRTRSVAGPLLSFVIPAFNEEPFIARALRAIHDSVREISHEVIVVDNGSTDLTPRIASELGATVIQKTDGTIGALRNRGVAAANGTILAFLDADVILTSQWAAHIRAAITALVESPRTLTGSICEVPANASWIERYWFAPREDTGTHIGSGHMLIHRAFFHSIGGFDESMATGEDYELSQRAVAHGGRIAPDRRLRVVHLGFPGNIRSFVRRESWHGMGDFGSISAILRSKVAVGTVVFAVLHALIPVLLLTRATWEATAAAAGIVSLCVLSSRRQYRSQSLRLILVNALVFWLYYLGRTLALVRVVIGDSTRGSR